MCKRWFHIIFTILAATLTTKLANVHGNGEHRFTRPYDLSTRPELHFDLPNIRVERHPDADILKGQPGVSRFGNRLAATECQQLVFKDVSDTEVLFPISSSHLGVSFGQITVHIHGDWSQSSETGLNTWDVLRRLAVLMDCPRLAQSGKSMRSEEERLGWGQAPKPVILHVYTAILPGHNPSLLNAPHQLPLNRSARSDDAEVCRHLRYMDEADKTPLRPVYVHGRSRYEISVGSYIYTVVGTFTEETEDGNTQGALVKVLEEYKMCPPSGSYGKKKRSDRGLGYEQRDLHLADTGGLTDSQSAILTVIAQTFNAITGSVHRKGEGEHDKTWAEQLVDSPFPAVCLWVGFIVGNANLALHGFPDAPAWFGSILGNAALVYWYRGVLREVLSWMGYPEVLLW